MANQTSDARGPGNKGASANQYGQNQGPQPGYPGNQPDALFDWDDVQPNIGPYLLDDDVLQVTVCSHSNITAVINYAILTRDSQIVLGQERLLNSNGNLGTTQSFNLREGFLLAVSIVPSSQVGTGNYLWASAGLRRLTQSLQSVYESLCQGYAYTIAPLSYPGSGCVIPSAGQPCIRVITGSAPAAGADISETVPTSARWQLLSLRASLTTAVAVANRQPKLTLDDGANRFYDTADGPAQAASLTWAYCFAPTGSPPANSLTDVQINYDNAQMLESGFRIRTVTSAIQAADQWSAPVYCVREWQGQF